MFRMICANSGGVEGVNDDRMLWVEMGSVVDTNAVHGYLKYEMVPSAQKQMLDASPAWCGGVKQLKPGAIKMNISLKNSHM